MIAADIFLPAISGFSNVAMFYNSGVRLINKDMVFELDPRYWIPCIDHFDNAKYAMLREETKCRNGHLHYKNHKSESSD